MAKNPIDGQWYSYDDSRVQLASEEAVQRSRQSAYLLFYQRKKSVVVEKDLISP